MSYKTLSKETGLDQKRIKRFFRNNKLTIKNKSHEIMFRSLYLKFKNDIIKSD
jgi:hypothetical protein